MTNEIAPEFTRFITAERSAHRLPDRLQPKDEGAITPPVIIKEKTASELLRVAARIASGLFRPTKRKEVVWGSSDSELAVSLVDLQVMFTDGLIHMIIPVRCDQTGNTEVEVFFVVGSPKQPAGLYASTYRRPNGPDLIVSVWGDALVAFAWQCLLGLVSGIAGATGKDSRGNVLVPVEMVALTGELKIVPMARHRFSGSSGLSGTTRKGGSR